MYPNLPGQAQVTPPVHMSLLLVPLSLAEVVWLTDSVVILLLRETKGLLRILQETRLILCQGQNLKARKLKSGGGKREVVIQRTIFTSMASHRRSMGRS